MQCVVLAGGLATRMRPATDTVPKWLLPVAGRPFAVHQLAWLADNGVDEVLACIGHLGDQIRDRVGDGSELGLRVSYSEDGPALAGTAGALRLAAARGLLRERFLLVYGDSFLPVAVRPVWEAFLARRQPALMTVYRDQDALEVPNAAYADGLVLRYHKASGRDQGGEPDASSGIVLDHVDYGLLAFQRSLFDAGDETSGAGGDPDPSDPSDLSDVLEVLADQGRLAGFPVRERFFEIGSPEGLRQLEAHLTAGAGDGRAP